MIKHKRLGHTILLLFVVIASALLFFDPFKIEKLADKEDILAINMCKDFYRPGAGGGSTRLGEVSFDDPEEISKVYDALSDYVFWRDHFRQPQRKFHSYSRDSTLIRVFVDFKNYEHFAFEITDASYNHIFYFDKYGSRSPMRDYSIGLPKDKQQAELYNTLDAFIAENNELS